MDKLPAGGAGIKQAFEQYASGLSLSPEKVTTLQDNLKFINSWIYTTVINIAMYVAAEKECFSNYHHPCFILSWYWRTCHRIIIKDKEEIFYSIQKARNYPGIFGL